MQQSLVITVPSAATDDLLQELAEMDAVITLSVQRGQGVKPTGDVLQATVLNRATDAVLERVQRCAQHGEIAVVESSLDYLIKSDAAKAVRRDTDESTWERSETGARKFSLPTLNYALEAATGAMIVICGLLSHTRATEATALVAAAIIAPVFNPLVRIALSVAKLRGDTLLEALRSAALGYGTVIAVSTLALLAFRSADHHSMTVFTANHVVLDVEHPPGTDLVMSACAALAGAVMVSTGRFTVLAGPLIALKLLPSCAVIGGGIALWRGHIIMRGTDRLLIDVSMILIIGIIFFVFKDVVVHGQRRALR